MPTLTQALHTFLQIDRAPVTNRNYERVLARLVTAIGPSRDVRRVTYEDVADYFYPLCRDKKRSTARQYLMVIQNFFSFCERRGYTRHSPARDLILRKVEEAPRQDRSVPPDDLAAMLAAARFDTKQYAILLFLIATGCRAGAIASLTLDNLDLDNQKAWVREKGGRWGWVYFGDETEAALREWLKERPECDHQYVFTLSKGYNYRPMRYHAFLYLTRMLSGKAKTRRLYSPHAFRHSRGHGLARMGVSISTIARMLNHRSIEVTDKFYAPNHDEYVALVARLHELAALHPVESRPPHTNVIPLQVKRKRRSG